ncbi:MAG: hypothetical protein ABL998_18800 [Planctomycetota bacterium]
MNACEAFLAELTEALAGAGGRLETLAHEPHLRACAACARHLRTERALERLLTRVPAPEVPAGLAERVRAGLTGASTVPPAVPLTYQQPEPELDTLLARAGAVDVPPGLAQGVLRGLAPERARLRRPGRILALAAAVLLLSLGGWAWWTARERFGPRAPGPIVVQEFDPLDIPLPPDDLLLEDDAELVAYALEHWELLNDAEFEVWLASLDPLEQLLIENADDELVESVLAGDAR